MKAKGLILNKYHYRNIIKILILSLQSYLNVAGVYTRYQ